MLGQALCREAKARGYRTIGIARAGADINLDITEDEKLMDAVATTGPDIVINTVAQINLGECEHNPARSYLLNARPASLLTELCRRENLYYIHISTDHYYTRDGDRKHNEDHPVQLLNEYARTKYAGERFALANPDALVLRTNIVGFREGPHSRQTFAEWVMKAVEENAPMTLFADYYTSSISVSQFSRALFDLTAKYPRGLLNLASREVVSKKQFIEAIAQRLGRTLRQARVGTIAEALGPRRAESLGLDVTRAETILDYSLPNVREVVESLVSERIAGES